MTNKEVHALFDVAPAEPKEDTTKPLTNTEARNYQQTLDNFMASIAKMSPNSIKRYNHNAKPQLPGGAQAAELSQHLTVEQLITAQRNMSYYTQIGDAILQLHQIKSNYIQEVVADVTAEAERTKRLPTKA